MKKTWRIWTPVFFLALGQQATAFADVGNPAAPGNDVIPFVNFSELKNSVVSKISAANDRVWLSTEFLTDGDVVGALHLAKYRNVDVQVLLGRQKANAYMSRLGFLKNQEIPTWIKPQKFMTAGQTAILSDHQLILIDGDLDFMTHRHNFVLRTATSAQALEFGAAFQAAVAEGLDVKPAPIPAVGRRPGRNPSRNQDKATGKSMDHTPGRTAYPDRGGRAYVPPAVAGSSEEQPFKYGRNGHSRPEGIPNKLPKTLKWKDADKIRKNQPSPDGR